MDTSKSESKRQNSKASQNMNNNQLILIESEKFDVYSSAEKKSIVEVIYTTRGNNESNYHIEIDFLPPTEKIYNYINNITNIGILDFRADFSQNAGIRIWDLLEYGESTTQESNLDVINEKGIYLGGANAYAELAKYQNIINDFLALYHQESMRNPIVYDMCVRNRSIYYYINNNQTTSSFIKIGTFKQNIYSISNDNKKSLQMSVKEYNNKYGNTSMIINIGGGLCMLYLNTITDTIEITTKDTSINKNYSNALKQLCNHYKFKDTNPLIVNLLTKCIHQASTNFKDINKTIML